MNDKAKIERCTAFLIELKSSGQFFNSAIELNHDRNGEDIEEELDELLKILK